MHLLKLRSFFHYFTWDVKDFVSLNIKKHIANVTLKYKDNDPFSSNHALRLMEIMKKLNDDENVSFIILNGDPMNGFMNGYNINQIYHELSSKSHMDGSKNFEDSSTYEFIYNSSILNQFMTKMEKPIFYNIKKNCFGSVSSFIFSTEYRIANVTSQWSFPEAFMGLVPFCGSSFYCNKLPSNLGLLFYLSGICIDSRNLFHSKVTNYYVAEGYADRLFEIFVDNDSENSLDIMRINSILKKSHSSSEDYNCRFVFQEIIDKIDYVFGLKSLNNIFDELDNLKSEHVLWRRINSRLKEIPPLSLKLSYELYRRSIGKTLEECIVEEFKVVINLLKDKDSDFCEFIKSKIINGYYGPYKWKFDSINQINDDCIEAYFASFSSQKQLKFNSY